MSEPLYEAPRTAAESRAWAEGKLAAGLLLALYGMWNLARSEPLSAADGMLSALFIDVLGAQRGALVFDTLLTALGVGIAWRAWSRLRSQA